MQIQIPAKALVVGQHFTAADNTSGMVAETIRTIRRGRRTIVTAHTVRDHEAQTFEFVGNTPVRVNVKNDW